MIVGSSEGTWKGTVERDFVVYRIENTISSGKTREIKLEDPYVEVCCNKLKIKP